ncbi:MAG: hypothetical protein JWM42_1097 [Burkholderia sp.]|nr:hypothetical protein [Burkholderia sp.]
MKAETIAHDVYIARQTAERYFRNPWPCRADGKQDKSGNDQVTLHRNKAYITFWKGLHVHKLIVPGTRMPLSGMANEADRKALVRYPEVAVKAPRRAHRDAPCVLLPRRNNPVAQFLLHAPR